MKEPLIIQFYIGQGEPEDPSWNTSVGAQLVPAMLWAEWIADTSPEELAKVGPLAEALGNTGTADLLMRYLATQGYDMHTMVMTLEQLLTVVFVRDVVTMPKPPAPEIA